MSTNSPNLNTTNMWQSPRKRSGLTSSSLRILPLPARTHTATPRDILHRHDNLVWIALKIDFNHL